MVPFQNYGHNFTMFHEEGIPPTQMECHYMFVYQSWVFFMCMF